MIDFAQPWALVLLPLAVLPLLRRRRDRLAYPHLAWLPRDRLGTAADWVWRVCAVTAIAATVAGLAGPGSAETTVARTGRGAEILVLIDRSRSMDERMLPADWRTIDPLNVRLQAGSRGAPKIIAARDLLSTFVRERADDRYALMFFSANPILAVPFTQHRDVVLAGIGAAGVGRGLSDTAVGRALLAASAEFDQRSYAGSRIIMLVSDGGTVLDGITRRDIGESFARNRITLYWIYLRSVNGPNLDKPDPTRTTTAELALHEFFTSLPTPYRAYQAESPDELARAINDVGAQQNLPFTFDERIPRRDGTRIALIAALIAGTGLFALRAAQLRQW